MKVSLVNLNLLGNDAVGRNLVAKARFFQARGDDVHIYTEERPQDVGDDVRRLCTAARLGELLAPGRDSALRGARDRFLSSELLIYDYPSWYPLVEMIAGVSTARVIFDYHGVTPPELWNDPGEREALERSVARLGLVHHADFALAHSPYTQVDLAARTGYDAARIFVLPYAVSPAELRPGPRDPALARRYGLDGAAVILYVGRMAGNKRVDLLVRALPLVRQRVPGAKLLLVGHTHGTRGYQGVVAGAQVLARELGIEQDVVFTGVIDHARLQEFYRLADVFAIASEHEGFCIPAIEAMACEVPVVVAAATALPWTVGDAGLTFAPGDVDGLAAKIVAALTDQPLHAELIARGRSRAAEFVPEKYTARLAAVVETVLASPVETRQAARAVGVASVVAPPVGLAALAREADTSLRDYVVRSHLPVVGPLVERLRYHLTSHVKEAYLDRLVERQVLFNLHLVGELRDVSRRLEALEREVHALRGASASSEGNQEQT